MKKFPMYSIYVLKKNNNRELLCVTHSYEKVFYNKFMMFGYDDDKAEIIEYVIEPDSIQELVDSRIYIKGDAVEESAYVNLMQADRDKRVINRYTLVG